MTSHGVSGRPVPVLHVGLPYLARCGTVLAAVGLHVIDRWWYGTRVDLHVGSLPVSVGRVYLSCRTLSRHCITIVHVDLDLGIPTCSLNYHILVDQDLQIMSRVPVIDPSCTVFPRLLDECNFNYGAHMYI